MPIELKTETVNFRCTPHFLAAMRAEAKQRGVELSDLIRTAVAEAMAKEGC